MRNVTLRAVSAALTLAALVPAGAALVAQSAPRAIVAARQRVVPLEGGNNFRDLGGYRTADGRTVKWGLLYRSAAMNGLTLRDYETLRARGINVVCDLRSSDERRTAPVKWPAQGGPRVLSDDYALNFDMRGLMQPGMDGPKTRAMMARFYRDLPFQFAGQYKRMFAELAAGHAPLAFNCSAGKDRTGVAAALLLTALGVPYETVVGDYLLSNRYFDPAKSVPGDPRSAAMFKRMPPEVIKALMGVDRAYLDSAFAAIRARPGGLKAYYRDQLGVDAATTNRLRAMYLQRA